MQLVNVGIMTQIWVRWTQTRTCFFKPLLIVMNVSCPPPVQSTVPICRLLPQWCGYILKDIGLADHVSVPKRFYIVSLACPPFTTWLWQAVWVCFFLLLSGKHGDFPTRFLVLSLPFSEFLSYSSSLSHLLLVALLPEFLCPFLFP